MSAPLSASPVDSADLRRAASRFPTGVALVTSPGALALVIDSFISVSLQPPLIAFSVSRTSLVFFGGAFGTVSMPEAAVRVSARARA